MVRTIANGQRSLIRLTALVLAFALALSSLNPALAVSQIEDDDLETYTSETYGYEISYDPEIWDLVNEGSDGGEDVLVINNDTAAITIYGWDVFADAEECLNTRLDLIEASGAVDDFEIIEEPSGDEEQAVVLLEYGSGLNAFIAELECFMATDELSITVVYEAAEDDFDTLLDERDDVIDSLTLEGQTPDEPDSTPGTAVDLDTYISETYGYEISYDPEIWNLIEEGSEFDEDVLVINNDAAAITIYGWNVYADAEECVDERLALIEASGVLDDFEIIEEPSGDEEQAVALIQYGSVANVFFAEVECFMATDDLSITVVYEAAEDDFDSLADARDDVIDSFALSDDITDDTDDPDDDRRSSRSDDDDGDNGTPDIDDEDTDDGVKDQVLGGLRPADDDDDQDEDIEVIDSDDSGTDVITLEPGADVTIEDDFENESTGVLPINSADPDNITLAYDGGQYVVSMVESEGGSSSNSVQPILSETTIAVDTEVISDDGSLTGVTCRAIVESNVLSGGYLLYLDPFSESMGIGVIEPNLGAITPIASESVSDIVEPEDGENRLELRCEGEDISGYLNDELVLEITDDTFEQGQAGIWVASYSDISIPVEVRFDNLVVEGVVSEE